MSETADPVEERGGSGAPETNEAPGGQSGGVESGTRNHSGAGGADQTQNAAWLSQLSQELKGDADAMKAVGGFRTISDLVKAYMERPPGKQAEPPPKDGGLEASLEAAAKKETASPPSWREAAAVKETTGKLIDEFGPAAAEYYKKALSHNGIGALLAQFGLKSHPDIGRALVLLGREMSEEYTPSGKAAGGRAKPVTLAEGARLYY